MTETKVLTFEDKKAIVIAHYNQAYHTKLDTKLHSDKYMELYDKMVQLRRNELNHLEKKKAQNFLQLIV